MLRVVIIHQNFDEKIFWSSLADRVEYYGIQLDDFLSNVQ